MPKGLYSGQASSAMGCAVSLFDEHEYCDDLRANGFRNRAGVVIALRHFFRDDADWSAIFNAVGFYSLERAKHFPTIFNACQDRHYFSDFDPWGVTNVVVGRKLECMGVNQTQSHLRQGPDSTHQYN